MSKNANVGIEGMVFRKTHEHPGRRISATPRNSAMQHLAYGRIILNPSKPGGIILHGRPGDGTDLSFRASDSHGGDTTLGQYDSIYVPRDSSVKVDQFERGYRGVFGRSQQALPTAGSEILEGFQRSRPEVQYWRAEFLTPAPHTAGEKHRSWKAGRRFHCFRARELDKLAAPRARQDAGRNVRVFQHAGSSFWHPTRV